MLLRRSNTPDPHPKWPQLFSDLNRIISRKKFNDNDKIVGETETYFEAKPTLYNENGMERLKFTIVGKYVEY